MAKRGGSSLLGSLVALVVLTMGVINWWSADGVATYYNSFVSKAYRGILVEHWNTYVDRARAGTSADADLKAYLTDSMRPALEKWSRIAAETAPPAEAAAFHSRFASFIESAKKDVDTMIAAIEAGDSTSYGSRIAHLSKAVQQISKDAVEFHREISERYDLESIETTK